MFIFKRQLIGISILRITSILLVLNFVFNGTKLSLFLHSFWLFLNARSAIQPLQVIIISTIYYSSSILVWSFIFYLCVVVCWNTCSHLSDQRSLILKLVLGCAVREYISQSILFFPLYFLVLEKIIFIPSLSFIEFTRTRFYSFLYTLLTWMTITKCYIPLQEFIKAWIFAARC